MVAYKTNEDLGSVLSVKCPVMNTVIEITRDGYDTCGQ